MSLQPFKSSKPHPLKPSVDVLNDYVFVAPGEVFSVIKKVTPEQARKWRDLYQFERQRKMLPANIERLSLVIDNGNFIQGTTINIAVLPDGTKMILNGNHTLEAIAATGKAQRLNIVFHDVADLDAAGAIYAVLDIHARRSWGATLKSLGLVMPNSAQICGAIKVIEDNFLQRGHHKVEDRIEVVNQVQSPEWTAAIEAYAAAMDGATTEGKELCRLSPIMAVALYTLRHQETDAYNFWETFSHDDGLRKGMPAKALMSFCRKNRSYLAGGYRSRTLTVRATVLAWNGHFRGQSLEMVKPTAMVRFQIAGTPMDKGFDTVNEEDTLL